MKRGDFFTDSKLKSILNHAYFVPLPESITKDEETGVYRQKILPLDAPLYFIPPPKKVEEEQQKVSEKEESVIKHKSVLFTDSVDGSDIEVDEEDTVLTSPSPPPLSSDTLAISDSKRRFSSSGSDDDLMLDIVGDEDIMDAIQPWKMRLLQSDKKKRKRDNQITAPEEEEPSKKKPKKSVRFA